MLSMQKSWWKLYINSFIAHEEWRENTGLLKKEVNTFKDLFYANY
jgi:hypothetical protein